MIFLPSHFHYFHLQWTKHNYGVETDVTTPKQISCGKTCPTIANPCYEAKHILPLAEGFSDSLTALHLLARTYADLSLWVKHRSAQVWVWGDEEAREFPSAACLHARTYAGSHANLFLHGIWHVVPEFSPAYVPPHASCGTFCLSRLEPGALLCKQGKLGRHSRSLILLRNSPECAGLGLINPQSTCPRQFSPHQASRNLPQ